MRDPSAYVKVYSNGEDDYIQLENIPEYDKEEYDFFNEKDVKKYFSDLERLVRSSFEYRQLVNYLRDHLNMSECSFYKNVNNLKNYKIKIEIHHDPLTLYDICKTIFNRRAANGESLNIEVVAKEVIYVHYLNLVGLIPLSQTVHELVHNNYLFVPSDIVYGNYKGFVDEYYNYMEPELIDTLERVEEATKVYNHQSNTEILDKKNVYIDYSGAYELADYEGLKDLLTNRISEIRQESKAKYLYFDDITSEKPKELIKPFTYNKIV